MSKQEADRVADALENGTYLLSVERDATAALLRQWPDGEPVAWVDDLARAQPHCVTAAEAVARAVIGSAK